MSYVCFAHSLLIFFVVILLDFFKRGLKHFSGKLRIYVHNRNDGHFRKGLFYSAPLKLNGTQEEDNSFPPSCNLKPLSLQGKKYDQRKRQLKNSANLP